MGISTMLTQLRGYLGAFNWLTPEGKFSPDLALSGAFTDDLDLQEGSEPGTATPHPTFHLISKGQCAFGRPDIGDADERRTQLRPISANANPQGEGLMPLKESRMALDAAAKGECPREAAIREVNRLLESAAELRATVRSTEVLYRRMLKSLKQGTPISEAMDDVHAG
jgi:hypothetical protein